MLATFRFDSRGRGLGLRGRRDTRGDLSLVWASEDAASTPAGLAPTPSSLISRKYSDGSNPGGYRR